MSGPRPCFHRKAGELWSNKGARRACATCRHMLRTGSSFSGRPCVQGRGGTLQKAQAHRRQQRQRGAGDRCRPWRGQAGKEEAVHSLAVDRRSEGGKVAAGLERGEARRSARSTTGDVHLDIAAVWAFIHVITLGVIPRTDAWLREVASCQWGGKRIREPFNPRFSIEETSDVEGEIFHEILKKRTTRSTAILLHSRAMRLCLSEEEKKSILLT